MASVLSSNNISGDEREELQRPAEFSLAGFLPVGVDELGFAMTFFVSSANGLISSQFGTITDPGGSSDPDFLRTFRELSSEVDLLGASVKLRVPHERTIDEAFLSLWRQYQGDERQLSICARVLGFYYLMEHTEGTAMARWLSACSDSPESVILDPAIMEALAAVSLSREGLLVRELFVSKIEAIIEDRNERHVDSVSSR